MQREKVIVVGGSGFVGRELCRLAVALGHEVVSISLDGRPDIDVLIEPWVAGVDWKKGNIEDDPDGLALQGAFSVILCTPPLTIQKFHQRMMKNKIQRIVLVQLAHFSVTDFLDYNRSYIVVRPFPVVDDEAWNMQSSNTVHVSNLGMALLRLGLEESVPDNLAGQDLVTFGDVMMIQ